MSDIKNLKCYCCKCYDSFDGCTAWSCKDDFEISIDKIKQATRNFAKRQFTWYKNMPYIHWIEIGEPPTTEIYVEEMLRILEQKLKLR